MARTRNSVPSGAARAGVLLATFVVGFSAVSAIAQAPNTPRNGNSAGIGSSSSDVGAVLKLQQQLNQPGPSVAPQGGTDASFRGSIVRDAATSGVLDLTLDDAIQRGLRNNLGLVLQTSQQDAANGQRLQQLQSLLPTVTGAVSIEVEQVNLAAFGLKFPGIKPIVGPFQVVDFRAYLTQNLINVQSLENYIAARHNFAAAKLTAEDARDLVVLTVGNAYLLCIADAARIESVKAEMETSNLSLKQANDAHEAGTSPRLDVLRAQVDYQNEQQNLIATQNQFEKDKIALARADRTSAGAAIPPCRYDSVCCAGHAGCRSKLSAGVEAAQGPRRSGGAVEGRRGQQESRMGGAVARRQLHR